MAEHSKSALVLLADGSEEIETVTVVDVLRRAGVDVTLAGLEGQRSYRCSRGVNVLADVGLTEATKRTYDAVVLPGGWQGALAFASSDQVGELLKRQNEQGRFIAAICAAPVALLSHGVAANRLITHHPAVKEQMDKTRVTFKRSGERVAQDEHVITSQGPGTSFEFSLRLVQSLLGKDKADQVAQFLLCKLQ